MIHTQPIYGPKILYTMRHGESIGNAKGKDDDSLTNLANHRFSLTKKGQEQIRQSATFFKQNNMFSDALQIYTSYFLRAQESIEVFLNQLDLNKKVYADSRLDEWWKGIFHSMNETDRCAYYPKEKEILKREGGIITDHHKDKQEKMWRLT